MSNNSELKTDTTESGSAIPEREMFSAVAGSGTRDGEPGGSLGETAGEGTKGLSSEELLQSISDSCALILKMLKKDETHDKQVNNLQRRCLQYEEGLVYNNIKGTVQSLIKLREDTKRNRTRIIQNPDIQADYLEDWTFDLDQLKQVAEDSFITQSDETSQEGPSEEDLDQLKSVKRSVTAEIDRDEGENARAMPYSTEQFRLSLICDNLLSRYDLLLQTIEILEQRAQALGRMCDSHIARGMREKVLRLHDGFIAERPEALSVDDYAELLDRMTDGIAQLLVQYGVSINSTEGILFDASKQKVKRIVATDDPTLSGQIKERFTEEYSYNGTIIYQEQVSVYKYKAN